MPAARPPTTISDPGAELCRLAAADRALVAAIPDGYWVPQLSSKTVGPMADGNTYCESSILKDHQAIRSGTRGVGTCVEQRLHDVL